MASLGGRYSDAMTDVEDKIRKIDLATTGQKIRRAIVEALEALNIYALPEPTEEDVGKTLVVDENGVWVIGDLPTGGGKGVLLVMGTSKLAVPHVDVMAKVSIEWEDKGMGYIDMSNAKIEPVGYHVFDSAMGLGTSPTIYVMLSDSGSSYKQMNVSRTYSGAELVVAVTGTVSWSGTELYLGTTNSSVAYKISGIQYEEGDILDVSLRFTVSGT
jgi:hypothetical protein